MKEAKKFLSLAGSSRVFTFRRDTEKDYSQVHALCQILGMSQDCETWLTLLGDFTLVRVKRKQPLEFA